MNDQQRLELHHALRAMIREHNRATDAWIQQLAFNAIQQICGQLGIDMPSIRRH